MCVILKSIRSHWLSIVVISILFVIQTFDSSNAGDKETGEQKGLRVTILIFSGRPDPTYILDDKDSIKRLGTLISAAKANDKFEKSTVIPSVLGYKGIVMDNEAKIPGIPAFVAVYKGDMEIKDEGIRFLADEGGAVENLLLNIGIEKGLIDEKVLKRMKSER